MSGNNGWDEDLVRASRPRIRWHRAYDAILFLIAVAILLWFIFYPGSKKPALVRVAAAKETLCNASHYPHKHSSHAKEKTSTSHGRHAKGVPLGPR